MMRRLRQSLGVLLALLLLAFLAQRWLAHRTGVEGWTDRAVPKANQIITDQMMRERFSGHLTGLNSKAYEDGFRYFLEGHLNYRSPKGAAVFYPGAHSFNGRTSDGFEAFSRFLPLAASWIASGRADSFEYAGRKVSIAQTLKEGLLAGTHRDSPEYWGVIRSRHQSLVESADIALGVWLSRKQIWATLSRPEQVQIATWLKRALEVDPYPGNWSLFPIIVHRVLTALGEDDCCNDVSMTRMYREFKQLYIGGGWIEDPPNGADYYNVWAMQYLLFWIDQIDPKFDPKFIRDSNRELVAFHSHLISPRGAPLWGRSVCYRMATSVPLLVAQALNPDVISKGLAMRALDATWGYFVTHGAIANGIITQGFCGKDLALVNEYTAPGSCLWGTRGLVVALYLDPTMQLLDVKREKLPVEIADYVVTEKSLKWSVQGFKDRGEVVLTLEKNADGADQPAFQSYGLKHQLREWVQHRPIRPNNRAAMYDRRHYSTTQSMTACERVNP
jgi:hypothetical protein